MHALLAFPVWLGGHSESKAAGMVTTASDAFVISTLATLLFILACAVLWIWLVRRRNQRQKLRQEWFDELLDDEQEPPRPIRRSAADKDSDQDDPPAPWEKPADWWKK